MEERDPEQIRSGAGDPDDGARPEIDPRLVERKSVCRAAVPILSIPLACSCFILNVFVPGSGKFNKLSSKKQP